MQAGTERERLLRVASELERELGFEAPPEVAGPVGRAASGRFKGLLEEEDERLVQAISEALSRLAAAIAAGAGDHLKGIRRATLAALDGAELVISAEIVAGREERVAEILPGAVFLVVLPALGEAEGLRLSRRTEELLAGMGSL